METLKLSGNMISVSTKPEDAGHEEFSRNYFKKNYELEKINEELMNLLKKSEAINADLLKAIKALSRDCDGKMLGTTKAPRLTILCAAKDAIFKAEKL